MVSIVTEETLHLPPPSIYNVHKNRIHFCLELCVEILQECFLFFRFFFISSSFILISHEALQHHFFLTFPICTHVHFLITNTDVLCEGQRNTCILGWTYPKHVQCSSCTQGGTHILGRTGCAALMGHFLTRNP